MTLMKKQVFSVAVAMLLCLSAFLGIQKYTNSPVMAGEWIQRPAVKKRCSCNACRGRRVKKRCRKCPKCNQDTCYLKCEKKEVTKTCYDIDQEVICIPRVTFPWQKCPSRCSRARTVNILGTKEYECTECKYTWKLCEPELPKPAGDKEGSSNRSKNSAPSDKLQQPGFERNELYDPAGSDVPTPPPASQINN